VQCRSPRRGFGRKGKSGGSGERKGKSRGNAQKTGHRRLDNQTAQAEQLVASHGVRYNSLGFAICSIQTLLQVVSSVLGCHASRDGPKWRKHVHLIDLLY
jgi:hypothetical protein